MSLQATMSCESMQQANGDFKFKIVALLILSLIASGFPKTNLTLIGDVYFSIQINGCRD